MLGILFSKIGLHKLHCLQTILLYIHDVRMKERGDKGEGGSSLSIDIVRADRSLRQFFLYE